MYTIHYSQNTEGKPRELDHEYTIGNDKTMDILCCI